MMNPAYREGQGGLQLYRRGLLLHQIDQVDSLLHGEVLAEVGLEIELWCSVQIT